MTDIGDSPAKGGLITDQRTTRQGAAAPIVVDTAPGASSGVALQTTVAEGGRVTIDIVDSPATSAGPITGQGTTRQGAAAPIVIETAPIVNSGVALQTTVGQRGDVVKGIEDSPAKGVGLITG